MTKPIFRSICAAALSVFLITFSLIMWALYGYISTMQQSQLDQQTELAARGVEQSGMEYLEGLSLGKYRITWIDGEGEVLYDNKSDSESMDNHLEREEIQEALASGHGQSSRYSSTLMERYLYSAQRLEDGTVIRLSVAHSSLVLILLGMLQPSLGIIGVALLLSFFLAGRLSRRIVKPLNNLNLDHPLENEGYDQLSPLLRRIYSQQNQLKHQREDLERKQNELDVIVGNMKEGMVLLDQKGRVISMNKAARRFLDAEESGGGEDFLEISRNLNLQQAVEQAGRGERAGATVTLQGRIIQISAAPVISEQGISGTAVVLFDITEKEMAEKQRREFTANVSHELKTPLHAISGYSELIKCGMVPEEKVAPFAGKIYDETQRLIRLVEDIINLSRLDEGAGQSQRVPVDLYQMAEEVVQSLKTAAKENQIEVELSGGSAQVLGIPELIHSIIYNLCDNGIKYNRRNGRVSLLVETFRDEAVLTVKDTGVGIPKEESERIFERFYRVEKSRSKEVEGTGLGLSIVKHAAQIHGAGIKVDSQVGAGTSIQLRFPLYRR